MNYLNLFSPGSSPQKMLASSMQQQEFSARDALLAAALEGKLSRAMNQYTPGASLFGLSGDNSNRHFNLAAGLLERSSSISNSNNNNNSILRDVLSNPVFSNTMLPALGASQASALDLSSQQSLLEAIERRRLNFDRVQTLRNQALSLTDEASYQAPVGDNFMSLLRRNAQMQQHHHHQRQQQQQALLQQHLRQQSPPAVITPSQQLNSDGTLAALGSAIRKKDSPYIDASSISDPDPAELARRRTRGGVTEPFPEKLHRMIEEVAEEGNSDIISFFGHRRAFGVHDADRFVKEVMPKYFKQSRLSSFQRQLNLYGFTRISSGPDTGGYYHELFLQGRPALCVHMRRVGVPQGEDRRKLKSAAKKPEPDFYTMKTIIAPRDQ